MDADDTVRYDLNDTALVYLVQVDSPVGNCPVNISLQATCDGRDCTQEAFISIESEAEEGSFSLTVYTEDKE